MFILQHSKITFYVLFSKHIMKRYLGLGSDSLGGCLGNLALALVALVLALEFAASLRLPYGDSR